MNENYISKNNNNIIEKQVLNIIQTKTNLQ